MENNIYKKLFEVKKAGIKLQRDTKAFNYKYATLNQIQEKLNVELGKQWLLVMHFIRDGKVTTQINDINTDEYIISEIELTEWIKPQDKWSEITYYRRYNLVSLLDLEVEDDDWKKAQDSVKSAPKKKSGKSDTDICPDCWIQATNIRKWTTKTWNPFHLANCECWESFFIKPDFFMNKDNLATKPSWDNK